MSDTMVERIETKLGSNSLIIETGKMAKQADGAVTVQQGGTVVLVTAVGAKELKEDSSFLPLTIEYQEKTYAAGKIPGGFFKREGRPTEKEILTARLIDRPIRPLFPKGFTNEIQIMALVLSSDGEYDPDVLAVIGGSCALAISDIPICDYIGALRIGMSGEKFVINPTYAELQNSPIDIVVAGTKKGIIMVESETREAPEKLILDAIEFGYSHLNELIDAQEKLVSSCGKPKLTPQLRLPDEELLKDVRKMSLSRLQEINRMSQKEQREEAMDTLLKELVKNLSKEGSGDSHLLSDYVKIALIEIEHDEVRRLILDKGIRVDGRNYQEIRPVSCEVGVLPRTHGSGLFTRGHTQSLSVTTLGTSHDEQMIEALEGESFKSFMLHYNFPPFSVGEIRPIRGPGRREIGHGALAERALKWVMPSKEEFPYTVRVVSDILESNGSSSMATVCAGSLSLMDAGVPIRAAVGGIAMGLIKDGDKEAILTDIAGLEDYYGDLDFKVAGTRQGITAIQMDVKRTEGIDIQTISHILQESLPARQFILDKMAEAIDRPRASLSVYAPRIITMRINPDKIREVIGPGGKMIRKITETTGATIDIEDDGKISIASVDESASLKAVEIIKGLTEDIEVGRIYKGRIKRIMPFGAFCEIAPGKEGLIHISELDDRFVNRVEDVVSVGDEVSVKVIEIDGQGRINLSKKQAKDEPR